MQNKKPSLIETQILSPLAVGDGGRLSPLADYFFAKGRLHRISPKKLEEWLWQHNKIDDYIDAIKKSSRYAKDFFWTKNMGFTNLETISSGKSYPLRGAENPIELRTIVKNGNQPYIPGSSIKGAFKTALLYHWLTEQKKDFLLTIITALKNKATRPGNGDVIDKITKGFLSADYADKFPRDFHHFLVSDSDPLSNDRVEIVATKRLHLTKGTFDIPVVSEAISPSDAATSFYLNLKPDFLHPQLQQLNNEGIPKLFEIANNFSKAHINWLLGRLKENEDNLVRRGNADIFDDACDWLQSIEYDINNAPGGTAWIQLGFGKTWFANSCGLAIYNGSKEAFNALRMLYPITKSKSPLFPVTISLGTHNFIPQGWVKMTIKR
jgi:CRISPR-associated protein Csm5